MGGPVDESGSMSTSRLGYRPGLDGIRAVAVALVLVHHLGYPSESISWIKGSMNIGVDIFFVLSGFLITRLLLDERVSSGTISLARFWLRRALRLLPLAVFVIATVWLLATIFDDLFFHSGEDVSITRDAIAALTYHMNVLVAIPGQYHVSALTHTWSLSVEEQFYLAWPLVVTLLARFRPGRISHAAITGIGAGVVVVASSITRLVVWEQPDRVYNGLDSRAGQICAGACLAALTLCAPGVLRTVTRFGWVGLAGLLALAFRVGTARFDSFGYDLVAALTVVTIAGVVMAPRSSLDRVLSHPALVWLGVRSYALYLVHFPLFLALTPERFSSIPRPIFFLARAALAVAVSDALHQRIELPIAKFRKRAQPAPPQLVPSLASRGVTHTW